MYRNKYVFQTDVSKNEMGQQRMVCSNMIGRAIILTIAKKVNKYQWYNMIGQFISLDQIAENQIRKSSRTHFTS